MGAYGGVTGSYSYTDEAGVHTVNYVADDLGFRVTSDNLPVGPANLAVAPVHVAEPVVDTPAVVEAKAAFFKAYDAAKSGIVKRSAQFLPQAYTGLSALNYAQFPLAYNNSAAAPALQSAGLSAINYAAPATVAAPAVAAPALSYAAAPAVAAPVAYAGAP